MPESWRLIERLVAFQLRRPLVPLALVLAVTAFFGFRAAHLSLNTRYDALLPQNAPSVIELHRLEKRTKSSQTILVVLEDADRATLRAMGDAIVKELRALDPNVVSSAEDGTQEARAFVAPRGALFLDRAELEKVAQQVNDRWDYEVQKADGFLLDEDAPPPPLPTIESMRGNKDANRFPTGYFENEQGTALVVSAHSPIAGGDFSRIEPALARVRAAVDRVHSAKEFSRVRVTFAGDMPTGFAEYHVVLTDLLDVGATGIGLVLAVVVFYFARIRAVLLMAITILVSLVWTFGLTEMVIGHLNVATSFLISIVAGNGINVGILYQSRYYEERARGADVKAAIASAVTATWQPTVIAALASAASYGSLLATDFRAFRDFGIIAASGMVICWIVKTLMLPPLIVLFERAYETKSRPLRWYEMAYGVPFAWAAPRAPRVVLAASVALATFGVVSGVRYATHDPLDYDLHTLENDHDPQNADLHHAWKIANGILGASQGAMIVATDSPDDARELAKALRARWDAAPADAKPFAAVHALSDFVPEEQDAKIPTAIALGDRLRRAHERNFMSDADWERLRDYVPPSDLKPFGEDDLPDAIASAFTERSGARGTLVLVEATPDTSMDLRTLVRFANAYRETKLPSGKIVEGSGSAVVFADILAAVARDVPRAVALSLGLTLAVVVITFHRARTELLVVLFALACGIGGLAIYLYYAHIKLNFLNFAALPITFGIGADYSINVAQRWEKNGRDAVAALRTSGGAVVLCSLTTLLGYLALLGSHNRAIRSLGTIASLGEVSCLLAAVVATPALFVVIERIAKRRARS